MGELKMPRKRHKHKKVDQNDQTDYTSTEEPDEVVDGAAYYVKLCFAAFVVSIVAATLYNVFIYATNRMAPEEDSKECPKDGKHPKVRVIATKEVNIVEVDKSKASQIKIDEKNKSKEEEKKESEEATPEPKYKAAAEIHVLEPEKHRFM